MSKAKRSDRPFGKKLLTYGLVLCLLTLAFWGVMWLLMRSYEKSHAVTEAELINSQTVFDEFVDSTSPEAWAQYWLADHPQTPESEENVLAAVNENFDRDSLSFWRAEDYTAESPVYSVKNGDTRLAKVHLEPEENSWRVSRVEVSLPEQSVTVRYPVGVDVCCNGTLLDDSYVTDTLDLFENERYAPDRVNPVLFREYTVTGLLEEPEITAQCTIPGAELWEEGETPCLTLTGSETEQINAAAKQFLHSMVLFVMWGGQSVYQNVTYVYRAVAEDSEAAEIIYDITVPIARATDHDQFDYTYTQDPVIRWADNVVTTRLNFDTVCYERGVEIKSSGYYELLFIDYGEGYQIYSFSGS